MLISRTGVEGVERVRPLWLALHAHHQAVAGPELGPYVDDEHSWGARRAMYLQHLEAGHGSFLLLAERGDAPASVDLVAYAMVAVVPVEETWIDDTWRTGPLIAEIESLVVMPDERGSGIGSRLLDRIDEELAAQGIGDVVIGAFAANSGALALYERRGFRPTWNYLSRFAGR